MTIESGSHCINRCRPVPLLHLIIVRALVVVGAVVGLQYVAQGAPTDTVSAIKPPASARPAQPAQYTAADPNAGFTLFISGNWLGKLEPCGCTEKQLGGIDRLTAVLSTVPPERKLLIDSGPLIEQDTRQSQLKLETFLRSFQHHRYDAIALTGLEIRLLAETLGLDPNAYPPVICTTMPDKPRTKLSIVAHYQKTLRSGGRRLDCLVMAVPDPREAASLAKAKGFQLASPIAAVKAVLTEKGINPEKASKNMLVVVMLTAANGPLTVELAHLPAVDILVTPGYTDEPEKCPRPDEKLLHITTGKLGKYLTRIDIVALPDSEREKLTVKPIAIEDTIARDPAVIKLLADYQQRMEVEDLIADETQSHRQGLEDENRFIGSGACAQSDCHEDIYTNWQDFKHAHAMETLIKAEHQFDPECVTCHSVGMQYETGYRSMETTPDLANVGCEMCHGPGANHAADEYAEYRDIFTQCETCHDYENSPKFDGSREEYFQKIKHWEADRRQYWQ